MRAKWTDLAMETCAGIPFSREQPASGIERTTIRIEDEQTALALEREPGSYVTLSYEQHMTLDMGMRRTLSRETARAIREMLPKDARQILVVGLGNRSVTPDALGPRTVERVLVTRHMQGCMPDEVLSRMASVCAATPGVMGVTGLETAEVLCGLAQHVHPDAIIAVDALAARGSQRICATIQIADSGITPGSGVGNHRRALTRETLGSPVIAVGVPMVVYASTLAGDAVGDMLRGQSGQQEDAQETEEEAEAIAASVERIVSAQLGEMIVTPREVDALVERMAGILAEGINLALHPQLKRDELEQLMAT